MSGGYDYLSATRKRYQDRETARAYHARYSARGWRHIRQRFVASRERVVLGRLLGDAHGKTVLDLPCGTGKMAPVLAGRTMNVISADISGEMLDIARQEYRRLGHRAVEFWQIDAESAADSLAGREIEVALCIRLMHRVPASVRASILENLAQLAPTVIVSYGVYSPAQRSRKFFLRLCKKIRGRSGDALDQPSRIQVERELEISFRIIRSQAIAPVLASERFFLLSSRQLGGPSGLAR